MITYHTSSERLYFSMPDDIIHIVIHMIPQKLSEKTIFFFLHMHISATGNFQQEILNMC